VTDHSDSIYVIWQDPTQYEHDEHGPPYLPNRLASVRPAVKGLIRQAAVGKASTFFDVVKKVLEDYQSVPLPSLGAVLAFLRALSVIHQSHHWMTTGPAFYADHLLFDRIYNDLLSEIDAIAERAVGMSSPVLVQPMLQVKHVGLLVSALYEEGSDRETPSDAMIQRSLVAELRFLLLMQVLTKELKESGELTRGTDNLLAGIEDKHEEHVYLLKQRLPGRMSLAI